MDTLCAEGAFNIHACFCCRLFYSMDYGLSYCKTHKQKIQFGFRDIKFNAVRLYFMQVHASACARMQADAII